MTLCSCCHADILSPRIATRAGAIFPGLGLCRSCYRRVGRPVRSALREARRAYRAMPLLEQALVFYGTWETALEQARLRHQFWVAA